MQDTGRSPLHLDELSGGQRQRAYIAMVIAQDTEYLSWFESNSKKQKERST